MTLLPVFSRIYLSTDSSPPPLITRYNAIKSSANTYSNPILSPAMKNPCERWTVNSATAMVAAIPAAPIRVKNPRSTMSPPKNSARIASVPRAGGMPICWKNWTVASKPYPPYQPRSFWEPWAKKIMPRAARRNTRLKFCIFSDIWLTPRISKPALPYLPGIRWCGCCRSEGMHRLQH